LIQWTTITAPELKLRLGLQLLDMLSSWLHAGLAAIISAAVVSCDSVDSTQTIRLAERADGATKQFEGGRFSTLVDEPQLVSPVDIGGHIRHSLTPPFPSRLSFDLEVPRAAFLEFFPALVMVQDVRRARIEFVVIVKADDDSEEVYGEVFRSNRANQWHERQVDLSDWSGERVLLTLEIRAVPARGNILWAERVQTVWGEPVVSSSPWKLYDAQIREAVGETAYSLQELADSSGVGPEQQLDALRFALNLFIGGLLAMVVRELFKRYCSTLINRERFANMLPLFTITTIAVIFVVQYSPALSLGLIGALSLVRFRVAITTTEELSYLLLAVALGVALGASHVLLGFAAVVVAAPFIVLRKWIPKRDRANSMLLTLEGDPDHFYADGEPSIIEIVRDMTLALTVHRLEHGPDRVYCRAHVTIESRARVVELLSMLRRRISHCQVSNLDGDASTP
jgi:hypothetical protein